ncbi:MAG TPA: NUDIX hydrolase [Flavobacteriales bacterium]|nr:NUDIX hydrolase [Flavobacteriales bacterium]
MKLMSFVIIEREDRFLLVKETSKKFKGLWFFTGGELQKGESFEDAALRETREELKCEITLSRIAHIRITNRIFDQNITIIYAGALKEDPPPKKADKNVLVSKWFNYEETLKLEMREHGHGIIEAYRNGAVPLPDIILNDKENNIHSLILKNKDHSYTRHH